MSELIRCINFIFTTNAIRVNGVFRRVFTINYTHRTCFTFRPRGFFTVRSSLSAQRSPTSPFGHSITRVFLARQISFAFSWYFDGTGHFHFVIAISSNL